MGKISPYEMFRTFNCGIGLALVVAPENVDSVVAKLGEKHEVAYQIGNLVSKMTGDDLFDRMPYFHYIFDRIRTHSEFA